VRANSFQAKFWRKLVQSLVDVRSSINGFLENSPPSQPIVERGTMEIIKMRR
jgi:hypothetical protein